MNQELEKKCEQDIIYEINDNLLCVPKKDTNLKFWPPWSQQVSHPATTDTSKDFFI